MLTLAAEDRDQNKVSDYLFDGFDSLERNKVSDYLFDGFDSLIENAV
ncbi:hypothetical protein [Bordetella genomosp. 5]|nr:hypothetical protein [Bordetella genomosp. 5]